MKRTAVALLALMLAVVSGCAAGGQKPASGEIRTRAAAYTNPVFEPKSSIPAEASDPMALKYNGEYYAYVTGGACGALRSTDLVKWEFLGPVVSDTASCWAPDVAHKNGVFYMYASTTRWGETEGDRRVRLYTATRPEGPFKYQADVTDHYSYDGHYFRASNGQEYLFWTRECLGSGVSPCGGNPNLVDTLTDMATLGGKPSLVGRPFDWECKGRCIFEAPQVFERAGLYYQLYSGGAYENETYGSGYARSSVVKGPDRLDDMSWRKMNQILKTVPNQVSGPGGSSWVKGPGNLEDWIIYHGRNKNAKGGLGRWLRIDSVMWSTDRFWLPGAPSYTEQPGPALPRFRDLFDRPDGSGLGEGWKAEAGQWAVKNGQALQSAAFGLARALAGEAADHYVVEANLRFEGAASGLAGVMGYYAGEEDWLQVLLRPADQAVVLRARVGGKEQAETVKRLTQQTRHDVFHQLLVRKNADRFDVVVDGLPITTLSFPFPEPGTAGLVTYDASATFDGYAFAHGWEDLFAVHVTQGLAGWGPAADGTKLAGRWSLKEGVPEQSSATGRAQAFKGSREWGSYQLTASLRPADPKTKGRIGLYAAYWDSRNYAALLLEPSTGQLVVRAEINGKTQKEQTIDLKQALGGALDFSAMHTLRVTKNGFDFFCDFDGVAVWKGRLELAQGQPGLLTEESAARYGSVLAVRWD